MESSKLIVTHRRNLTTKFGKEGTEAIDAAVTALVAADAGRGIRAHYVHIDDLEEMRRYGSKAVSKNPAATSCKRVIDKLCNSVTPDYIVLLGSYEIIPHFRVPNPTFAEEGDTDPDVATDSPYASSSAFNAKTRASYLVSDRVVGRIPEIPGQRDPSPLIDYLNAAASSKPLDLADFALDLLVCCDTWKKSGGACVAEASREMTNLFLSPPTDTDTADFQKRHIARVQMIKCHGAPLDPNFYGQEGENFPAVLYSGSLAGKTARGTVVGAMCCFGAAVYDPSHPAAITPGVESIANVYLKQGAAGFVGSTGTSWVGVSEMACADLIVCRFLTNVMSGMSLGAALLDSKQRFMADINKDGRMIDAAEEKTLMQFLLLGDSSLRAVTSTEERGAVRSIVEAVGSHFVAGGNVSDPDDSGKHFRMAIRSTEPSTMPNMASAAERRSRRAYHLRTARNLRETLPQREQIEEPFTAAQILSADEMAYLGARKPMVQRVARVSIKRREQRSERGAVMAGMAGVETTAQASVDAASKEETFQYYWCARTVRERVIDATIVKVETDLHGNVLRKRLLVTA